MLRCSRHALINQQGEIKMEADWTFSGTLLNLISLSVPMVIFLRESRIMNSSKILTLNLSDKTLSRDPSPVAGVQSKRPLSEKVYLKLLFTTRGGWFVFLEVSTTYEV